MNITDYTIHSSTPITGTTFATYIYVSADVTVSLEVSGECFTAYLQNGDYLYGDYDRPSSKFSEILDYSDDELVELQKYTESDLEDEDVIKKLNEKTGREWSFQQWSNLYVALNDATDFAFDEVVKPEKERVENEIKELDENHVFVEVTERESWGANDDEWRVCAEPRVYKFDTRDEAIDFRDEERENGNLAMIVDATRYYELES